MHADACCCECALSRSWPPSLYVNTNAAKPAVASACLAPCRPLQSPGSALHLATQQPQPPASMVLCAHIVYSDQICVPAPCLAGIVRGSMSAVWRCQDESARAALTSGTARAARHGMPLPSPRRAWPCVTTPLSVLPLTAHEHEQRASTLMPCVPATPNCARWAAAHDRPPSPVAGGWRQRSAHVQHTYVPYADVCPVTPFASALVGRSLPTLYSRKLVAACTCTCSAVHWWAAVLRQ